MGPKNFNYERIDGNDEEVEPVIKASSSKGVLRNLLAFNLLLLVALVILISVLGSRVGDLKFFHSSKDDPFRATPADLFQRGYTREVAFKWNAGVYASANESERNNVDAAWDAFDWTFGLVGIPLDQARQAGIPETHPMQEDSSKGVFLVQGYHLLHCVVSTAIHHARLSAS